MSMWHFASTGVAGMDLYSWDSRERTWRWTGTSHPTYPITSSKMASISCPNAYGLGVPQKGMGPKGQESPTRTRSGGHAKSQPNRSSRSREKCRNRPKTARFRGKSGPAVKDRPRMKTPQTGFGCEPARRPPRGLGRPGGPPGPDRSSRFRAGRPPSRAKWTLPSTAILTDIWRPGRWGWRPSAASGGLRPPGQSSRPSRPHPGRTLGRRAEPSRIIQG